MDSASDVALHRSSILVVDDNSTLRETLAAVLEDAGYKVFQASNGKAVADIRHEGVALLITDLVMPEREGIETIRQFIQGFPHIPIIAMSGMPEYLPVAKALGAAIILEKPIAYADLLRAVRTLIG
jgi:CheY-like chemotaxis protein